MALKRPSGTPVVIEHTSKILKDNPLGDPHVRKLQSVEAQRAAEKSRVVCSNSAAR